jgi:hypothetical protein
LSACKEEVLAPVSNLAVSLRFHGLMKIDSSQPIMIRCFGPVSKFADREVPSSALISVLIDSANNNKAKILIMGQTSTTKHRLCYQINPVSKPKTRAIASHRVFITPLI